MRNIKQHTNSFRDLTFSQPFSPLNIFLAGLRRNNLLLLWALLSYASLFLESFLLQILYKFNSFDHTPSSFHFIAIVTPIFLLCLLITGNTGDNDKPSHEYLFNRSLNFLRNQFLTVSLFPVAAFLLMFRESEWRSLPQAFQVSIIGAWLSMPWSLLVLSILYQQKNLQYPLIPCKLRYWWSLVLLLPLTFQALGLPLLSLIIKVSGNICICLTVWRSIPGQSLFSFFSRPITLNTIQSYRTRFRNIFVFLLLAYVCLFVSSLSLKGSLSGDTLYEKLLIYKYHFLTLLLSVKAFLALSRSALIFLTYSDLLFRIQSFIKLHTSIFINSTLPLLCLAPIAFIVEPSFAYKGFAVAVLLTFIAISTLLNSALILLRPHTALNFSLLTIILLIANSDSLISFSAVQQLLLLYAFSTIIILLLPAPNIKRKHTPAAAQLRLLLESPTPLLGFSMHSTDGETAHSLRFSNGTLWLSPTTGVVLLNTDSKDILDNIYAMSRWSICDSTNKEVRMQFVKRIINGDFYKDDPISPLQPFLQIEYSIKRSVLGWNISSIPDLYDQNAALNYLDKLHRAGSSTWLSLYKKKVSPGWLFRFQEKADLEILYLNKTQRVHQDLLLQQLGNATINQRP